MQVTPVRPAIQIVRFARTDAQFARTLWERLFRVPDGTTFNLPPRPIEGAFVDGLKHVYSFFKRNAVKRRPLSNDEFVAVCQPHKRRLYREVCAELAVKPFNVRDSRISYFGKDEKVDKTAKPDPVMRLVSPRHPRYNVELGRFTRAIEHDVYHLLDKLFGYRVVMKGLNAAERAEVIVSHWEHVGDGACALSTDMKRMDQHCSADALRWEHSIYPLFFSGASAHRLRWILSMQIFNKGFYRGKRFLFKINKEGARCSGDMNTSLGNILLMCSMAYSVLKKHGLLRHIRFVNDGDDCVFIGSRAALQKLSGVLTKEFLDFGFNIKVESVVDVVERVEFCRSHPVFTNSGWKMVRNYPNALGSDTMYLGTRSALGPWLRSVADGGLAAWRDVPVYGAFYSLYDRSAPSKGAYTPLSGFQWLVRGMRSSDQITARARASFWRAFGVLPDEQKRLEARYARSRISLENVVSGKGSLGYISDGFCLNVA